MINWLRKKDRKVEGKKNIPIISKKVLIVEDNELDMTLFSGLLKAHGYEIYQLREGSNVIQRANEIRPHLILMEIQLPVLSGLEIMKMIKEDDALKDIPVMAVTAVAMNGDTERFRKAGFRAYNLKPITVTLFLETVRELLAGETSAGPYHFPKQIRRKKKVSPAPKQRHRKNKASLDYRKQYGRRGWKFSFSEFLENLNCISSSLDPEENVFISNYNFELEKLKTYVPQNIKVWFEAPIYQIVSSLIETTNDLIASSENNMDARKALPVFHILAGLADEDSLESTKNFKRAVEIMESMLSKSPKLLTLVKENKFRENFFQAYRLLAESDPQNRSSYEEKFAALIMKLPKEKRDRTLFRLSPEFTWTEAKIQSAAKFRREGKSYEEIGLAMVTSSHIIMGMLTDQTMYRPSPADFRFP